MALRRRWCKCAEWMSAWAARNVRWRPDSGVHHLTGIFLHVSFVTTCGQQVVKHEGNFWTDHNGHNHRGTACGILKSYWTMRNCGCVDKRYFHTQRKGASGLAKHDNMHVCVSFGTHSLCVCMYPCWSFVLVASWKPWWKCVRMCRYWSSSSRGRFGYLSSHGVLQPKHTFFCLGLGCAYQCLKTYSQESYQSFRSEK